MPDSPPLPHSIYLAGRWVDSPDRLRIENPALPGEPAGWTYTATAVVVEVTVKLMDF